MKRKLQVMTANRLLDGAVVYLGSGGAWTEALDAAEIADTDEAASVLEATAKAAVAERRVVGPYLFAVQIVDGRPRPIGQRETIRAAGPTVGTDMPHTTSFPVLETA